jgi:predicted RNA polymerase sigma factor
VTLNKAVAVGMARGPLAGLAVLGDLEGDERMAGNHRVDSVRGHLLERAGDRAAAHAAYLKAAAMTTSVPEQRYLTMRAALTSSEH